VAPTLDEPFTTLTSAPVREVPLTRPFRWLALGLRDLQRAPGPSLFHGLVVAAGGWAIFAITAKLWYLLPGAFSGFVLIGPILATGLYELSRRMAAGESATLRDAMRAWSRGTRPLVQLGLLLALAATGWVLASSVLIALFVQAPITGVESFVRHVVLSQSSNLFYLWVLLGGIGAALIFAGTVVSAPLLLDREIDFASAVLTSVRAVGANPLAMALWAAIIMLASLASLLSLMLGFVVAVPVIGHATWHAYRDVVDAETWPPRR
jgi:uncharacterized membrane protein